MYFITSTEFPLFLEDNEVEIKKNSIFNIDIFWL